jgi:type II secretory pathway pseudopilin PulG
MVIETRRKKTDGLAFTLLETLLVVVILIALLGAIVYNFEAARRGSDLEEGARQVEALVRFAGAQAANSGKAVQFRFGGDVTLTSGTNSTSDVSGNSEGEFVPIEHMEEVSAKLRVVFEVDPVAQPGVFIDLREATPFLEAIADRVRIETVRMPEGLQNQRTNDLTFVQDAPTGPPTVTFYPDGSSDTAEIVLHSVDGEDQREAIVRVDGVTGSVRSELKSYDDFVPIEWMDDEGSPPKPESAVAASGPAPVTSSTTEQPATTPMPEDPAFDDLNKLETVNTNVFDEDLP